MGKTYRVKELYKIIGIFLLLSFVFSGCGTSDKKTENDKKLQSGETWETGTRTTSADPGIITEYDYREDASVLATAPDDSFSFSYLTPPYEDDGGQTPIGPEILTAGAFSDALNIDVFETFISSPEIISTWTSIQNVTEIDEVINTQSWLDLIPANDPTPKQKLDLSLVVDVTGSMGDELEYLKAEFHDIASKISEKYPDVEQRYSLIVYRDEGDQYISRGITFTNDIEQYNEFLSNQFATGGGDYPEAMHIALEEANSNLVWGDENTAKILFLVADAPPHNEFIGKTMEEVFLLRQKDVAIYPVAASGVADAAEGIMRTAAIITGGQYIFLTDDSGVGNTHQEPHIPCYSVEKLNHIMIRMIESEISQTYIEPDSNNIIRSVGTSNAGICIEASR